LWSEAGPAALGRREPATGPEFGLTWWGCSPAGVLTPGCLTLRGPSALAMTDSDLSDRR
jgi:hypothetical protein